MTIHDMSALGTSEIRLFQVGLLIFVQAWKGFRGPDIFWRIVWICLECSAFHNPACLIAKLWASVLLTNVGVNEPRYSSSRSNGSSNPMPKKNYQILVGVFSFQILSVLIYTVRKYGENGHEMSSCWGIWDLLRPSDLQFGLRFGPS